MSLSSCWYGFTHLTIVFNHNTRDEIINVIQLELHIWTFVQPRFELLRLRNLFAKKAFSIFQLMTSINSHSSSAHLLQAADALVLPMKTFNKTVTIQNNRKKSGIVMCYTTVNPNCSRVAHMYRLLGSYALTKTRRMKNISWCLSFQRDITV